MPEKTLVTCYINPDLDGVAGAFAYAEFLRKTGQNVEAAIIGGMHDEAKYVIEKFNLEKPKNIDNSDGYDRVILVDASDLNGVEGKIEPKKVIEIIDHRKIHEAEKFPAAKVQIELVGAAATLVAERFMHQNVEPSRESAILLFSAIISNTLNFKGSITTERDRTTAKWLNEQAHLPDGYWKELFAAKSDLSGEKLAERIEGDFADFTLGGKKVGIAQIEMIGAKRLLDDREGEVVHELDKLKDNMRLDFVFMNMIDLEEGTNYFVVSEEVTRNLLRKALALHFEGDVAEGSVLMMRKQIVPIMKEALENT